MAGNAMAAFSAAMAGASSMRGWSPEPAHKLDDERFLRTVVVTGFWSLARARRKNNWSQTGRPEMRWLHFRPRWLAHRRCGDGRRNLPTSWTMKGSYGRLS